MSAWGHRLETDLVLQALNYYKEAVKDEDNNSLRYDMAELQMRLKTFDRAEKTIQQALQLEQENQHDLNSLMFQAKFQVESRIRPKCRLVY